MIVPYGHKVEIKEKSFRQKSGEKKRSLQLLSEWLMERSRELHEKRNMMLEVISISRDTTKRFLSGDDYQLTVFYCERNKV